MAEPGVVIFLERPPPDWRRAALSLANACPGLTYGDAARACRYSQGFLELVLSPVQLEAAANALTAAGTPAAVLPISRRVSVPPAFTLLRMGLDDLGFSGVEPKSTAFARVPWKRVHLIHLAWVAAGSRRARRDPTIDTLDSSLLGLTPVPREPDRAGAVDPPELWLDLVLAEPFARVRIRMSSFVYDCVGEQRPRSEDNVRELLRLISVRAPKAIRAGLVERSLGGEDLDDSAPLDEHENDRAVSWELTRLGREFSDVVVEEPRPPAASPDSLERAALLLARFRRVVLLAASIPLAVMARMALLQGYPSLSVRMLWLVQLVLWVPIVALLSLLYVGVQMRLDTMKERLARGSERS